MDMKYLDKSIGTITETIESKSRIWKNILAMGHQGVDWEAWAQMRKWEFELSQAIGSGVIKAPEY